MNRFSPAYVQGFITECFKQGVMEKTATVLLCTAQGSPRDGITKEATGLNGLLRWLIAAKPGSMLTPFGKGVLGGGAAYTAYDSFGPGADARALAREENKTRMRDSVGQAARSALAAGESVGEKMLTALPQPSVSRRLSVLEEAKAKAKSGQSKTPGDIRKKHRAAIGNTDKQ